MVRAFVRIAVIASVGCGMAFAARTGASADAPREMPSSFDRLLGRGLGTVLSSSGNRVVAYNSPSHGSPTTVSGPLNSGRSTGSNQYYSVGNVINSGDLSNDNGVTASSRT